MVRHSIQRVIGQGWQGFHTCSTNTSCKNKYSNYGNSGNPVQNKGDL